MYGAQFLLCLIAVLAHSVPSESITPMRGILANSGSFSDFFHNVDNEHPKVVDDHPGESINCYVCNSIYEPKCEDNPHKNGLRPMKCTAKEYERFMESHTKPTLLDFKFNIDVPDSMFRCLKVDMEVHGVKIVERGCVPSRKMTGVPCDLYESMFTSSEQKRHCNICETDGCNAATVSYPSLLHIFLLTTTSFVLTVYRPVL